MNCVGCHTRSRVPTLASLRYPIYLLLLTISVFARSESYDTDIQFQRILDGSRGDNALGTIGAIAQDEDGFLWLGGTQGLGRYDGHELRMYRSHSDDPYSLSSNYIFDVELDSAGTLWVATDDGLSRYDRQLDRFDVFRSAPGDNASVPDDQVVSLERDDRRGLLYIGTKAGLAYFDTASGQLHRTGYQAPINKVHVDDSGRLWVGLYDRGLVQLSSQTHDVMVSYSMGVGAERDNSLCGNEILDLESDASGGLWVATLGNGICRFHPDQGRFESMPQLGAGTIWDLFLDQDNQMWVATDHGGLARYVPTSSSFAYYRHDIHEPKTLLSDNIRRVFQDAMGDLWVSTFPGGLNYHDRTTSAFTNYAHHPLRPESLSNSSIIDVLEDHEGDIWVGTERGLNKLSSAGGIDRVTWGGLGTETVLSLAQATDGRLWVGTWSHGLKLIDPASRSVRTYVPIPGKAGSLSGKFIWKVYVDSDDHLWVGTETGGLNRFRPNTDSFERFTHVPGDSTSIASNYVKTMLEDRAGNFWVGTLGGLNLLDRTTGSFTQFLPSESARGSIGGQRVVALFEDSRGRLWVGTQEAGVSIRDPISGTFRSLGEDDGLPSSNVTSIIETPDGYIWLSTTRGLVQVNPDTMEIRIFNAGHGLIGSNFYRDASLLTEGGMLYFGATTGLTAFDPASVDVAEAPPRVVLSDFKVMNKRALPGKPGSPLQAAASQAAEVRLKPEHAMFAFTFSALSYRAAEQNQYAYRLDGFDTSWVHTGRDRVATYTNLPPGEYVFRVKAANGFGIWNETAMSVRVNMAPPWWRTWWAYLGYLLGISTIAGLCRHHARLRRRSEAYREQSLTDPLTGIPNRAGISSIVEKWLGHGRECRDVIVMLLDLDHFKRINDTLGHDVGDRVLKEVARVVGGRLRHDDHLGRWGGEEFILICEGTPLEHARHLAETVRARVEEHVFERGAATSLPITMSIGLAKLAPGETFDAALKRADEALYAAKRGGRNQVILAG